VCCPTLVGEVSDGTVQRYELRPEDLGLTRSAPAALAGSDPLDAADEAVRLLSGEQRDAKRDMVLANAAAGIYVGGKAASLTEGVVVAREALDSGRALERLRDLIRATGGDFSRVDGDGRP
jgi:anthranilate phosphoribosyltransferase